MLFPEMGFHAHIEVLVSIICNKVWLDVRLTSS
jgi:hypothetical protein